jgi:hypothetical protein
MKMAILHIYRSEPDETTKELAKAMSEDAVEVHLYKGDVDYEGLVKKIFECDKVICWW